MEFWSFGAYVLRLPLKLIGETNRVQQPTVGLTVEKLWINSARALDQFCAEILRKLSKEGSKIDLGGTQEAPKWSPGERKSPKSVPGASQERPRASQVCPKSAQERPKNVPRALESVPRTPQERPKGP